MNHKQKTNPRTEAAKVLQAVVYNGQSLSAALIDIDDSMTRDLCYGSLRWHEPITVLLNELLTKKIKNKDKDVECLIRVGLYQLIYQNTPDHAAVSETVTALKGLKKPWAKNLVNAVLRNYLRGSDKLQKTLQSNDNAKYAFPEWLFKEIKKAWPNNWKEILLESNQHAPMTLRVNLNNNRRDEYLDKLKEQDIKASAIDEVATAVVLEKPINVFDLPGFKQGDSSVQDGAAQLASILLDCKDGMSVLDACAAPGGKTGHILESANNLEVIAVDNSESRLKRVKQNLDRLSLTAKIITADALDTDHYAKDILFDRILLDAPCSATGVIRRHPDIKVLRRETDIQELCKLQSNMLDVLWNKLKIDGVLLYATCSILPQENEEQIETFIKKTDDVEVMKIPKAQGHGRQIFPGENSMDGFYFCKLKKIKC